MDTSNITFNGIPLEEIIGIQKRTKTEREFQEQVTEKKKQIYHTCKTKLSRSRSGKDFRPGKVRHLTPEEIAKEYNIMNEKQLTKTEKILGYLLTTISYDPISLIAEETGTYPGTVSSVISRIKQNLPEYLQVKGRGTSKHPFTYRLNPGHGMNLERLHSMYNEANLKAKKTSVSKSPETKKDTVPSLSASSSSEAKRLTPVELATRARVSLDMLNYRLIECVRNNLTVVINLTKHAETQTPQVELKVLKEI